MFKYARLYNNNNNTYLTHMNVSNYDFCDYFFIMFFFISTNINFFFSFYIYFCFDFSL